MNTRTICLLDDFLDIKDEYVHRISESEEVTSFYTYRWLEGCWKCLSDYDSIQFFCIYSDDKLVSVIPLKFHVYSRCGLKIRIGSLMGLHLAPFSVPSNGIPNGWEHSFLSWLFSTEIPSWTVLNFGPIMEYSMVGKILLRSLKDKGLPHELRPARHHYFRFEGTWEGFLKNQSRHFRRTFNVKEKDALVKGRLKNQRVKNPTSRVLRETVFRVSEKSWQGQRGLAVASTEQGRGFYEYLANSKEEFDVDLNLIWDGQKCVSYLLGVVKHGIYHAFDTGFDPDYARYSPGYLMLWFTIRELFDEGISEFDYGHEHHYKYRYHFQYHDSFTLFLCRNRLIAATSNLWKLIRSQLKPSFRAGATPQSS